MSRFLMVRLGKAPESVAAMRKIDALVPPLSVPVRITLTCSQVPVSASAGDYVFLYMGSDNSKGGETEWRRGLRALGTLTSKSGGPLYNDQWALEVEVRAVLPDSMSTADLGQAAPAAMNDWSDVPMVGPAKTSIQQTVQEVKVPSPALDALLYAIGAKYPNFKSEVLVAYPELAHLFNYRPGVPESNRTESGGLENASAGPTDLSRLVSDYAAALGVAGLRALDPSLRRFVAALLSKRFVVVTGLSGSGKTKLVQAFARWISPDPGWKNEADHSKGKLPNPNYELIPVGADWTGNENILGYPNGLDGKSYITRPALDLIQRAIANADAPHFLILDEMNLSHVERYFADILSAMESGEEIPLHQDEDRQADGQKVPQKIALPPNLFIAGTVNVDETTYMFSPKVLDRANVLEFRMDGAQVESFLANPRGVNLDSLDGKGAAYGRALVENARDLSVTAPAGASSEFADGMRVFFDLLAQHNAEFGYRTIYEAGRFVEFYRRLGGDPDAAGPWFDDAMDAVVVQKLLPKLHGSRNRMEGLLWALAWACAWTPATGADGIKSFAAETREAGKAQDSAKYDPGVAWAEFEKARPERPAAEARYPLSYDKVLRMWHKLLRDQFVSFTEA